MLNKVMIIGNLGSDPEMRYTPQGNAVTTFSVATNRRYKTGDGEQHEEVVWFRVSAWGNLAENTSQYLEKGSKVFVEGRIKPIRIYETQSGEARANLEISALDVRFLSPLDSGGGNGYDAHEPVGAAPRQNTRPDAHEPVGAAPRQNTRPDAPQGRQVDNDDLPW